MTVNIIKLCVGIDSIDHLLEVRERNRANHGLDYNFHITRFKPKRAEEILDGGSIYWVIKGFIQARQRIIGFEEVKSDNGTKCMIKMDKKIYPTESQPRRAFQGWRYLEVASSPADLPENSPEIEMPTELRNDLKELGLI